MGMLDMKEYCLSGVLVNPVLVGPAIAALIVRVITLLAMVVLSQTPTVMAFFCELLMTLLLAVSTVFTPAAVTAWGRTGPGNGRSGGCRVVQRSVESGGRAGDAARREGDNHWRRRREYGRGQRELHEGDVPVAGHASDHVSGGGNAKNSRPADAGMSGEFSQLLRLAALAADMVANAAACPVASDAARSGREQCGHDKCGCKYDIAARTTPASSTTGASTTAQAGWRNQRATGMGQAGNATTRNPAGNPG